MSKTKDFLDSQHSLGENTKENYIHAIGKFEGISKKPFEEVYLDSNLVHNVLNQLSKEVSVSSWNLYLGKYKRLAKWLFDPEDETAPRLWRKIKAKKVDWEKKLKDKWLSKKQFYKLLSVVDYARDKALFSVCIEGALRCGELIGLKIKDVRKSSYGYDITVSGKTGTSSFPVVLFAPLLTQWLNLHPFRENPEAPLWPRKNYGRTGWFKESLGRDGVHIALKKYANRVGLPKNISIHWLRHSKITWTAKNKKVRISDEMAKKMFRWSKNSTMFSHYTHLHGVDSRNAFLSLAGVKQEEEVVEDKSLDLKVCFNCNEKNSATMLYCGKCGMILDELEAKRLVQKEKLMQLMLKDFQEKRLLEIEQKKKKEQKT